MTTDSTEAKTKDKRKWQTVVLTHNQNSELEQMDCKPFIDEDGIYGCRALAQKTETIAKEPLANPTTMIAPGLIRHIGSHTNPDGSYTTEKEINVERCRTSHTGHLWRVDCGEKDVWYQAYRVTRAIEFKH